MGDSTLDSVVRIDQAFLQLDFAVKLLQYIEDEKISKKEFDIAIDVASRFGTLSFPQNSFHTYDDLIHAAQNNYMITLGFSAIAMDSSIDKNEWKNNPNDTSPDGQLRLLVYMVRCAFAHDMMTPVWNVKPNNFKTIPIYIGSQVHHVDLKALNGTRFEDDHIGGLAGWISIRDQVRKRLSNGKP